MASEALITRHTIANTFNNRVLSIRCCPTANVTVYMSAFTQHSDGGSDEYQQYLNTSIQCDVYIYNIIYSMWISLANNWHQESVLPFSTRGNYSHNHCSPWCVLPWIDSWLDRSFCSMRPAASLQTSWHVLTSLMMMNYFLFFRDSEKNICITFSGSTSY